MPEEGGGQEGGQLPSTPLLYDQLTLFQPGGQIMPPHYYQPSPIQILGRCGVSVIACFDGTGVASK